MSLIATDTPQFSHVVKHEYAPELGYCRQAMVANEASATTYVPGTVVGIVTATGKVRRVEATAADGSQNAVGVVVQNATLAAGVDQTVLVLVRGPSIVARGQLVFGASVDTAPERTTIFNALEARGILVNDSI